MTQGTGYELARSLLILAAAALLLGGPVLIFMTWWGDCSDAACPRAGSLDLVIYASNAVAWVGSVIVVLRPSGRRRWLFILAFGLWLGAQVIAGWLGARAFEFAWVLMPAALQLGAAGLIGSRATAGTVPAEGRTAASVTALGCAMYPVAYLVGFGALTIASGESGGWLLVILPVLAVVIAIVLATRLAGPEPGS